MILRGYLALAEWYESRGQTAEAVHYLRQVLELDPLCRTAQLALLSLYRTQDMPGEVLDDYERLIMAATQTQGDRFRCRTCGQASTEPFWKCPSCHTWATPERLLPRPGTMPSMAGDLTPRLSETLPTAAAPIVATRDTPGPPAPSV